MGRVNVYKSPYHWEYEGFEKYVYLYPLKIIRKYLDANSIGIDIGCGDCKITSMIANMIKEVYGIDILMEPLQFGRRLAKSENLRLIQANCLQLPFGASIFDLAFMFDVIEHIPFEQLPQLLSEVRRVLKPEGFLFLTTPNYKNTLRSKGKIPEKHYFELSYKEVLAILEDNKLRLIEFRGVYPRPISKKLHRHIKKRKYLYATMTKWGRWFPYLCDTFVVVAQNVKN